MKRSSGLMLGDAPFSLELNSRTEPQTAQTPFSPKLEAPKPEPKPRPPPSQAQAQKAPTPETLNPPPPKSRSRHAALRWPRLPTPLPKAREVNGTLSCWDLRGLRKGGRRRVGGRFVGLVKFSVRVLQRS